MALNNLTVPTDDADEFQRILDAAYKNTRTASRT